MHNRKILAIALASFLMASMAMMAMAADSYAWHRRPTATTPPPEPEPTPTTEPEPTPTTEPTPTPVAPMLGGQHMPSTADTTISSVTLTARARTTGSPSATVEIVQNGQVKGTATLLSSSLSGTNYGQVSAFFSSVTVNGNYDIVVRGSALVLLRQADAIPGNYFLGTTESESSDLVLLINSAQMPQTPSNPGSPGSTPMPTEGTGTLNLFAHRIPSEHWSATFAGNPPVGMWFTLHNSKGFIVFKGYFNEDGVFDEKFNKIGTITGLNAAETHYIFASGCDECHGSDHDVLFDHWEDGGTDNPRTLSTLTDQHAYFRYDPDTGK